MKERELTTYCGIYCGDCPRYKAKFSDLAGALLKEFERIHFSEFSKLYGFEDYDKVISLLEVLPHLRCDTTCREGKDGSGGSCKVKACVKEKSIEGCWECDEFETCGNLDFLKPFCGDAPLNNLKKIKKYGLENWAEHREKQYPWL